MPSELFDLTQIDNAPKEPGVYVWYVRPQIGRCDWEARLDGLGTDQTDHSFRQVLHDFTRCVAPPELVVDTRLAFRDGWGGVLGPKKYHDSQGKILAGRRQLG